MSAKTPKKISLGGVGPRPQQEPPLKGWHEVTITDPVVSDNWSKVSNNMQRCELCMHYAGMRCRRHAPRGQEGWPAVFPSDWCGDHKMSKATMTSRS